MKVNSDSSAIIYNKKKTSIGANSDTSPLPMEEKPVNIPVLRMTNSRLEDFRNLLSRSKPIMSDEEFLNAARELARKDFGLGIRDGVEFEALRDAFLSPVSPDRVAIVEDAFRQLSTASNRTHIRDLLHAIDKLEGRESSAEISNLTLTPTGKIATVDIHDSGGNRIASFCNLNGWSVTFTSEEWERHHKILAVYNDEWFALHNESKRENSRFELMQSDAGVGSFDIKA